jgi:hypothetical protein
MAAGRPLPAKAVSGSGIGSLELTRAVLNLCMTMSLSLPRVSILNGL